MEKNSKEEFDKLSNKIQELANRSSRPVFPVWSLLAAVLVVLKLVGVISISWWWVLAPVWIPLAIVFGILALVLIVVVIAVAAGAKVIDDCSNENTEAAKLNTDTPEEKPASAVVHVAVIPVVSEEEMAPDTPENKEPEKPKRTRRSGKKKTSNETDTNNNGQEPASENGNSAK